MPFCPKCREEFRQDVKFCAECSVALVDSLDEKIEIEDLAVVCTVSQEANAFILQGFLENEGVPCQLENLSFHPAPAGDLTKVRLWVRKDDLENARRILEEGEEGNTCSACGHFAMAQDKVCDFCGEKFESDSGVSG